MHRRHKAGDCDTAIGFRTSSCREFRAGVEAKFKHDLCPRGWKNRGRKGCWQERRRSHPTADQSSFAVATQRHAAIATSVKNLAFEAIGIQSSGSPPRGQSVLQTSVRHSQTQIWSPDSRQGKLALVGAGGGPWGGHWALDVGIAANSHDIRCQDCFSQGFKLPGEPGRALTVQEGVGCVDESEAFSPGGAWPAPPPGQDRSVHRGSAPAFSPWPSPWALLSKRVQSR
jgi:hypothetical protein